MQNSELPGTSGFSLLSLGWKCKLTNEIIPGLHTLCVCVCVFVCDQNNLPLVTNPWTVSAWPKMSYGICQPLCPFCCLSENLGSLYRKVVPGVFCNVMVFMICRMGMWILHTEHVYFEQWLGQVDPWRPVPCAFVRGLKRDRKGHLKTLMF